MTANSPKPITTQAQLQQLIADGRLVTTQPVPQAQLQQLLSRPQQVTTVGPYHCPNCGAELISQARLDPSRQEIAIPVTENHIILYCPLCRK